MPGHPGHRQSEFWVHLDSHPKMRPLRKTNVFGANVGFSWRFQLAPSTRIDVAKHAGRNALVGQVPLQQQPLYSARKDLGVNNHTCPLCVLISCNVYVDDDDDDGDDDDDDAAAAADGCDADDVDADSVDGAVMAMTMKRKPRSFRGGVISKPNTSQ